jgi:peptidoglycan/LPS O-acetylase OafA/YrhL
MAQLNRPLSNTISIYLDALRFGAAVIVLLAHVAHERFGNQALGFHAPGGDAVIVFFVLSGFVIAYVAETKENNLADFLSARFARLWSVLLPALVLTAAVELLCWRVDSSQREVFKFLATATFTGELWFSDQTPLLNAPAWTLSFELWYYLLFAAYIHRTASNPRMDGMAAISGASRYLCIFQSRRF